MTNTCEEVGKCPIYQTMKITIADLEAKNANLQSVTDKLYKALNDLYKNLDPVTHTVHLTKDTLKALACYENNIKSRQTHLNYP